MINKKLIITSLTIIFILLIPSTNAFFIKTSVNEKNEVLQQTGSVYGIVSYSHQPGYTIVPFAKVWIGLKRDICDAQGHFNISGLELEREYTFYYSAIGFKTKSIEFYLQSKFPHKKLWPGFTKDDLIIKEKTEKTEGTGRIYGNVEVCRTGYIPHPEIPFATVDAEIKKVRCNIKGDYWILELPLDQTYNVTASAYRYFPQTKIVTLTENSPSRCVHFCLKKDYDSKARAINQDVSCGGTIYGHTLESHDTWGAYPVPFALVDAGIKKTISGPLSNYRITGLPFDQEITITASKKGYYNDTLKHTFTEKRSTYYYCFDLQEDEDDSIDVKTIEGTTSNGKIYGYTYRPMIWSWFPIPFARVRIGLQTKRTDKEGYYEFTNLPVDKTYTIVADAIGYSRNTEKVTLTTRKPEVWQNIGLHPIFDEDSVNVKTKQEANDESADLGRIHGSVYEASFFERIIEVLNKYGMLFESQPKGYSNVEMKSI